MPDKAPPPAGGEAAAFWSFSLAFYARPGVAETCLALQDEHGLDVNVVLLCCWLGWSGRGLLGAPELAAAEGRVAAWRREVVEKLRAVRRALKTLPAPGAPGLRRAVQRLELDAEREAQSLILAGLRSTPATPDRLADAASNLELYLAAVPHGATSRTTLLDALRNLNEG